MIYFKDSEVVGLDKTLVSMLDVARGLAGIPFIITSGLRTIEENKKSGGVENSAHLKGLAVDLRCKNSTERFLIVKSLLKTGFKRIEIGLDHIHTDIDESKPQEVIF
jgi:hypothetical protein